MNPTAPIDDILYVNDLDGQIGEVNLSTGAVTDIVETGLDDLSDIAITSSGVLYGTTPTALYMINKATGASTLVLSYNGVGDGEINGLVAVGSTLYATSGVTSSVYASNYSEGSIVTITGATGGDSSGDISYSPVTTFLYETLSN